MFNLEITVLKFKDSEWYTLMVQEQVSRASKAQPSDSTNASGGEHAGTF